MEILEKLLFFYRKLKILMLFYVNYPLLNFIYNQTKYIFDLVFSLYWIMTNSRWLFITVFVLGYYIINYKALSYHD